ncbi:glycoside hydrolase family 13 protein [Sporolactobacillus shoreae]|uniref:Glycoside hydrolase family 13 protein n=1 Tax=Sporolactobacillus shoreae TaxID=1465501 RepID=A0A4Z0GPX3_9BACL|nr:glycoside hydrolase family 13 protein [Sporolactobacillus shoreae]TGA98111.1 glycoside hydrolase family 13 protein [Sporolactobacillus shoreae]
MEASPVYFNSWSQKFRRPFGAVQCGQSVYFSIEVNYKNTLHVMLVAHKDGEPSREQEMFRSSDNPHIYKNKFSTSEPAGLYFYHFRIEFKDDRGVTHTVYYGRAEDDYGGRGFLYNDPSKIRQYQLTGYGFRDPAPDWYCHGVIYHIFVDRFNNGNRNHIIEQPKKNSFIYATEEDDPYYIRDHEGNIVRWDFYGGNLKGVINKLHYLHDLGITVLYLSPIFEASSNHKYNTADFRTIDPMFGDEKTFRKLISRADKLGIHILLDGVFNHVGADSIYFNRFKHYGEGGAFNDKFSPYYDWFSFRHFPDSYDCWWNISDLPAVNKTNERYRKFIYQSEESIVDTWTETGIGGWRLDVADELPDDFIAGIRSAVERHGSAGDKKVLIGEVWEDASNKMAYGKRRHYLEGGMLHGVMNYPFRTMILDLLHGKIDARLAVRLSLTMKSNYPPDAFLANMNNIGTHDTERILTMLSGDLRKLRIAVWLLMTLPGVPCVYYGDEAGVAGGKDPDNRRFFPWGRENRETESFFREAIQARRADANLQAGDYLPFSSGNLFGFIRYGSTAGPTVLVINVTSEEETLVAGHLNDETDSDDLSDVVFSVFNRTVSIKPFDFILAKAVPDKRFGLFNP